MMTAVAGGNPGRCEAIRIKKRLDGGDGAKTGLEKGDHDDQPKEKTPPDKKDQGRHQGKDALRQPGKSAMVSEGPRKTPGWRDKGGFLRVAGLCQGF